MKFGYTIVYVPEVTAAIEFWERAFGLTRRFVDETGSYGELATGETVLSFAADSMATANHLTIRPNRAEDDAPGIELALVTDDVEAAFDQAIAAGATAIAAAEVKPWGQTVAYVRDLNGVLIELCTPIS